jgi:hypothetical protein
MRAAIRESFVLVWVEMWVIHSWDARQAALRGAKRRFGLPAMLIARDSTSPGDDHDRGTGYTLTCGPSGDLADVQRLDNVDFDDLSSLPWRTYAVDLGALLSDSDVHRSYDSRSQKLPQYRPSFSLTPGPEGYRKCHVCKGRGSWVGIDNWIKYCWNCKETGWVEC